MTRRILDIVRDHCAGTYNDDPASWTFIGSPAELIAALEHSVRRVRHNKRGSTYTVLGDAEVQAKGMIIEGEVVTVYRCESDGLLWVRPRDEFNDGRFADLETTFSEAPLQRPEEQA